MVIAASGLLRLDGTFTIIRLSGHQMFATDKTQADRAGTAIVSFPD